MELRTPPSGEAAPPQAGLRPGRTDEASVAPRVVATQSPYDGNCAIGDRHCGKLTRITFISSSLSTGF